MLLSRKKFTLSCSAYRALIVLLVSMLSSCSFTLRGTDPATYSPISLRVHVSAKVPDLKHIVTTSLRSHGYQLDSNQPEIIVQIRSESISKFDEGFMVDFTTMNKTLTYSTVIVFIQSDGTVLWGPETLSYSINFTEQQGSEQVNQSIQRDTLQKARNRAAMQITRQLNRVLHDMAGNETSTSN